MAAAYAVTGDTAYAHRVGVLLDRVADLYPSQDFGKQGVMYEGPPRSGYVSTWHDACAETRLRVVLRDDTRAAEAMLHQAGIEAVIKLPGRTLHLLAGLNADQYAAEMRGQLAMPLAA